MQYSFYSPNGNWARDQLQRFQTSDEFYTVEASKKGKSRICLDKNSQIFGFARFFNINCDFNKNGSIFLQEAIIGTSFIYKGLLILKENQLYISLYNKEVKLLFDFSLFDQIITILSKKYFLKKNTF